jgi:DNA-binding winged helix-turn-helix (wHTH) protein
MNAKPSTALITPGDGSIARHQANVQTLEWPIQNSHSSSSMREQIARKDLDGYRIVSLPFPALEGGSPPRSADMEQLLLVPLTWKQLLTRLRRDMDYSSASNESQVVRFGQVRIDFLAMEVCRSDRPVSLTALEFKVLQFFVSHPNQVISRDDLLNQVWGYENYPCTRTVDNQVFKLRQKLEPAAGQPAHFRTVHGVGYKFVP